MIHSKCGETATENKYIKSFFFYFTLFSPLLNTKALPIQLSLLSDKSSMCDAFLPLHNQAHKASEYSMIENPIILIELCRCGICLSVCLSRVI